MPFQRPGNITTRRRRRRVAAEHEEDELGRVPTAGWGSFAGSREHPLCPNIAKREDMSYEWDTASGEQRIGGPVSGVCTVETRGDLQLARFFVSQGRLPGEM